MAEFKRVAVLFDRAESTRQVLLAMARTEIDPVKALEEAARQWLAATDAPDGFVWEDVLTLPATLLESVGLSMVEIVPAHVVAADMVLQEPEERVIPTPPVGADLRKGGA